LSRQDQNYTKISEREIYSIDILFYASFKALNRIFNPSQLRKYQFSDTPYLDKLVKEIDNIILNKLPLKNRIKISSPDDLGIPKFEFVDSNFGRYLDIPKDTPEILHRKKIRNFMFTAVFFGFLGVLKISGDHLIKILNKK